MNIFFKYLKNYFASGFIWQIHAWLGLFLALTIWLNYYFELHERVTKHFYETPFSVIIYFAFYAFAFLVATCVVSIYQDENKLITNKKYIVFGLIGLFFLALDNSYFLLQFADSFLPRDPFVARWTQSLISNLSSFVTVILPLYLIYFLTKHFKPELYGFRLNGSKPLPYFWLILFMIPLIYLASFRPDFLHTYPTYTDNWEYKLLGVEQWKTVGIYELCYGFDFISVELFFRGFLVVALSKFAGKYAVIPMVVVYAFLHFGKPAGETISSIFGGYILGILAFESRNIFGGLIAHLGVAWGMEYFAWLKS